eukprot:SAG22_NODE_673_length_7973_cov_3.643129_4_plen_211_part_00
MYTLTLWRWAGLGWAPPPGYTPRLGLAERHRRGVPQRHRRLDVRRARRLDRGGRQGVAARLRRFVHRRLLALEHFGLRDVNARCRPAARAPRAPRRRRGARTAARWRRAAQCVYSHVFSYFRFWVHASHVPGPRCTACIIACGSIFAPRRPAEEATGIHRAGRGRGRADRAARSTERAEVRLAPPRCASSRPSPRPEPGARSSLRHAFGQ